MHRLLPLLLALLLAAACGADGDDSTPPADADDASSADAPRSPTTAPPVDEPSSATTEAPPATESSSADDPAESTDATDAPATTEPPTTTEPPQVASDAAVAVAARSLDFAPVAGFEQPLDLVWDTAGEGPYVAEKTGRLYLLDGASGESQLVLDLSAEVSTNSERGLLGVEFSPDGAWLYASTTTLDGTSRLAAYPLTGSFPLDPATAVELATIAQPFSNHNGGDLAIGPDGFLYWAMGDGGSGGDPENNGQDLTTLLGSILRIAPTPADGGYAIPADNPFTGTGSGEIWLWGLRNPWKMSFDRATGDLWIGDVGQDAVEEINRVPAGESGWNLGWNCFEGDRAFAGCDPEDHLFPVAIYDHSQGASVAGGYVYRGTAIEDLAGAYLFGDFVSGRVWALPTDADRAVETSLSAPGLGAFGEAPDGELWMALLGGDVGRIVG
ncbi:MAG: PQQ-dependent sugar dehydrogenase [Actinomycetota bacterium]